jgi:hypothetical protein
MDMTAALISAGAAILVCLINNYYMDKRRAAKAETDFEVLKASITAEIKALTKEVEKHNNVIERVYALETKADVFEEKMKVANHRIDDLEGSKAS